MNKLKYQRVSKVGSNEKKMVQEPKTVDGQRYSRWEFYFTSKNVTDWTRNNLDTEI